MRALSNILSAFPKEFNKVNNAGARMQDSIYHMTLKLHFVTEFCFRKRDVFSTSVHNVTT